MFNLYFNLFLMELHQNHLYLKIQNKMARKYEIFIYFSK